MNAIRRFEAGPAAIVLDAGAGGRLVSLVVAGEELLRQRVTDPLGWGCYPMAPWAGRLRDGRFAFGARHYTLPRNMPPHAIHGTVLAQAWEWVADDTLATTLGPDWPFPGRVEQRFRLSPRGLEIHLEVQAMGHPFPASLGLHPWFRRKLARGGELELDFAADWRYARIDGIPTGELLAPGPRPWDDCFTALQHPPRLRWPGVLSLRLSSNHPQWVVYDEPEDALCVEPLTAPPNALNGAAHLVTPLRPLTLSLRIDWDIDG
jgi:aldose 1-epimerase